jgi:hypothetical protein
MTTADLIRLLIKRGWLPLNAIMLALQAEEEGHLSPNTETEK